MDLKNLSNETSNLVDDGACNHLLNMEIPQISLPNQDHSMLKLNRLDSFRIVIFCFSMTGRPDRSLPPNWRIYPGAKGCTSQNLSFRDNYEEIIKLNAIPIGVSTQSTDDLKEMVERLKIPFDVVSDYYLEFKKILNLPSFSINNKVYLKRTTLILEKLIIKKIFYPIFSPDKHVYDVIRWLKKN
tara:strand:- start:16047 stop:16601 length:555 start_codon:yes stop_codon:yes gene_type:complete